MAFTLNEGQSIAPGYYWVTSKQYGGEMIAGWNGEHWYSVGSDYAYDMEQVGILSPRLEEPMQR